MAAFVFTRLDVANDEETTNMPFVDVFFNNSGQLLLTMKSVSAGKFWQQWHKLHSHYRLVIISIFLILSGDAVAYFFNFPLYIQLSGYL